MNFVFEQPNKSIKNLFQLAFIKINKTSLGRSQGGVVDAYF